MKLKVYAVGVGTEYYDGNFKLTDDNHCKFFLAQEVDYIHDVLRPSGKLNVTSLVPFLVTQEQYLKRLTMTTYPVNSKMYWLMKDLELVLQGMSTNLINSTLDVFNLFVKLLVDKKCILKRNDVVDELGKFNFNVIEIEKGQNDYTFVWTEAVK